MIGFDVKRMFFNSKIVRSKTDKATRRVLSKFGAFVRQTAKRSIRKRKNASQPGKPPSGHIGLLKKFIFFGFDVIRRSVVIGPVRLSQKGRGEAPSALEHGGIVMMQSRRRGGKRTRTRIRPRPFMGPTMEKEKPKLSAMWRDSIK